MLNSISWPEFFTTVTFLIVGYYVITTLLLYGSEITNIFKERKSKHSSSQIKADQNDSNESNDLMGSVRYENRELKNVPREEVSDAEDLQVVSLREEEEPLYAVDLAEESLKHDFVSIQSEINSLVEVVSQLSKGESAPLFKILLSNYPQFRATPYQQQISQLIHDTCREGGSHNFEPDEINSWWTHPETDTDNHQ